MSSVTLVLPLFVVLPVHVQPACLSVCLSVGFPESCEWIFNEILGPVHPRIGDSRLDFDGDLYLNF